MAQQCANIIIIKVVKKDEKTVACCIAKCIAIFARLYFMKDKRDNFGTN